MVTPLRPFLLNRQIATEARRIAHAATKTCKVPNPTVDHDDEHTRNCNTLKREIVALAMQVKLAGLQGPAGPGQPPPLFEEANDSDAL